MRARSSSRWWDEPQTRGVQGTHARTAGTGELIYCPACREHPVVYNGNYFCDNWNYPAGPGDCDWALAHPATEQHDREVCDLIGIDYDEE